MYIIYIILKENFINQLLLLKILKLITLKRNLMSIYVSRIMLFFNIFNYYICVNQITIFQRIMD